MRACPIASSAAVPISTPMRGTRSRCCARVATGRVAPAPPSSVMNSRRDHSITSSARASTSGTVRPSALAVLRLIATRTSSALHRKVDRLLALEDAVDIGGRAPKLVEEIWPVGHQAVGGRPEPAIVDRG